MIRRIKNIAIIVGICILLVFGLNFGVKKIAVIRSKSKPLQQEATKNTSCQKVFKFTCSKKTGKCKTTYDAALYECTKEGKTVYLITKILTIIIIAAGIILIIKTIFKNNIL